MQIRNITLIPEQNRHQTVLKYCSCKNSLPYDSVNFSGKSENHEQYLNAQKYANKMKVLNFFIEKNFQDYNLEKLEGIQNGIKIFEGMNIKEIAFLFENLHTIAIKRGCSNQCLHCYAGALPPEKDHDNYISRMPYETFIELTKGIGEIRERLGINPAKYKGEHYTDLYYDADCMEISLFDKEGREHDLTDLTDIYYKATNYQSIFDTAGWNPKNSKMQKRAEKYVNYFLSMDNEDKFFQINLSISPFNPAYARALELGYNPVNYSATTSVENQNSYDKGEQLYKIYINRIANMLYTFTPMLGEDNFNIIARPVENWETNMKNFTINDYKLIKKHVLDTLYLKYLDDLNTEQKYIQFQSQIKNNIMRYSDLMDNYDTDLIPAGRFKTLYLKRNPDINEKELENKFEEITYYKNSFENLKKYKNFKNTKMKYFKIIDANGRLHLYDGFRFIPTELQLNIETKDKITPAFSPKSEDFIITKEMINKNYAKKKSR